jgi:hypothetical protein
VGRWVAESVGRWCVGDWVGVMGSWIGRCVGRWVLGKWLIGRVGWWLRGFEAAWVGK